MDVTSLIRYTHKESFILPPHPQYVSQGWQHCHFDLPVEEIRSNRETGLQHKYMKKSLPEIEEWLKSSLDHEEEHNGGWTTKLIHMHCALEDGGWMRNVCPVDFCTLFRTIGLAEDVIRFDFMEIFGFHCFRHLVADELSFFLKLGRSTFAMWVYRPATRETIACLCLMHACLKDNHYADNVHICVDWTSWLEHPLGLFMDLKRRTLRSLNRDIGDATRSLAKTSCQAGLHGEDKAEAYNTLSVRMSRSFYRTFECCMLRSIPSLQEVSRHEVLRAWCKGLDTVQTVEYDRIRAAMSTFDSMLQLCAKSRTKEFQVLKDRIMVVQSVILNRVTRMDADTNIGLAKDSKQIAVATLNDSSSMKAIALMTMIFLPATFFATLFAMPGIDWKPTLSVRPEIWIYSLCSVVTTVIVLAVWFFNRKSVLIKDVDQIKNAEAANPVLEVSSTGRHEISKQSSRSTKSTMIRRLLWNQALNRKTIVDIKAEELV